MGVRGLLSVIEGNQAYEIIDLISKARSNTIEIIVDTHSLKRCIVEIAIMKISKDFGNEFLLLPVGEYDIMGEIYFDFHMAFREAGINLIWVVDGPKGVDEDSSERKISTWRRRDEEGIARNNLIFDACLNEKRMTQLNNCSPIIDLESGLEQLKRAGAEIIHLLRGEADDFIAHEYQRRGAYAILSNDTDYVLFKDCNVIFEKLFTLYYGNDRMRLPFIDECNHGKVFKRPTSFYCAISNSSLVSRTLNLGNYDQLVATCILKGNDFTTDHAAKLTNLLGITRNTNQFPHITRIADYVRSNNATVRSILNHPSVRAHLLSHPDVEESISYSRKFYTLENITDAITNITPVSDDLGRFLSEKVKSGKINRYCYAMHNGYYFETVCPEQLGSTCESIMDILGDIRQRIYPFLLKMGLNSVREWRYRIKKFVNVPVTQNKIQADKIVGIPGGLKIFEIIWSHKERNILHYVDHFGLEKALILYLLRYLHRINDNQNLNLKRDEIKALFVTVFYQFNCSKGIIMSPEIRRESFLKMRICPTARCLTIVTWFMNLYYTAKYICGGALDLTDSFPSPVAIMNGSTLFAFFSTIREYEPRTNQLPQNMIADLNSLKRQILEEFDDEYKAVTQMYV